MNQKKMVPDCIREFGSITPLDAFKDLGATRLAAGIFELKEDGHDMHTERERSKNRFGQATRYARYSFGRDKRNENQTR